MLGVVVQGTDNGARGLRFDSRARRSHLGRFFTKYYPGARPRRWIPQSLHTLALYLAYYEGLILICCLRQETVLL